MTEQAVSLTVGQGLELEARYTPGGGNDGGVICHPHTLFGGTMDNNVVLACRDALVARGLAALRFNFRGAGNSGGSHDDGNGEMEDVRAALSDLRSRIGDGARVHLVAYSFGAWVATRALQTEPPPASLILISPPLDFLSFDGLVLPDCPALVLTGAEDEFCSLDALDAWLPGAGSFQSHKRILQGADHFYTGFERRLQEEVEDFLPRG